MVIREVRVQKESQKLVEQTSGRDTRVHLHTSREEYCGLHLQYADKIFNARMHDYDIRQDYCR